MEQNELHIKVNEIGDRIMEQVKQLASKLTAAEVALKFKEIEVAALEAKCERYEAALRDILKQRDYYSVIELADKALSAGVREKKGGMPQLTDPVLSEEDMKTWEENQKEDQQ